MSNIAKLPNMQEDDGPRPPLEFKDTDQPLNPFDPKNLTVAPDYRALVGEPLLTAIKVGKPGKDHFFRVRPGAENYLPQAAILEFNPANERDAGRYLVLNGLVPKFMSSPKLGAHIRICNLYTCVTRQALPFLWALPQDDGSARFAQCHRTAEIAAQRAKEEWVNLCWNAIKKDYDITPGKFPLEPVFLDVPLPKLLEIGFGPGGDHLVHGPSRDPATSRIHLI